MRAPGLDSTAFRPTRRGVLTGALALASPGVSAAKVRSFSAGAFTHGVASGDPDAQSFVIWTRFVTRDAAAGAIAWEVAESDSFAKVIRRGDIAINPADDFCAKTLVTGLRPGRRYFYRFLAADGPSPVGLSRTTPAGKIDAFTFAAFSCSNLPYGYFHAYADAAARDDVELCLHLGDYIYEPARGTYPSAQEAVPGRIIEPAGELLSYQDYCARYASYRADPDLQELHRLKPWAVIWDDHEIANNAWMNGADAHDPLTEGDWATRKAGAVKAYLDWMPIRRAPRDGLRIYRRLDWGNLASILLLDTRLIGRHHQADIRGALTEPFRQGGEAFKSAALKFAQEQLADPQRSLLGASQERWLAEQMSQSKARGASWQVLAQQVVMGRQLMPLSSQKLLPPTASDGNKEFAGMGVALAELGLPWNMDSWSGYPAARDRILQSCAHNAANVLALAGDSHSAWAHNLPGGLGARDDAPAAVELGVTSVTSPGFERTFSNAAPGERESAMKETNAELAWCNVTQRGYCVTKLTQAGAEAAFIQLSQVCAKERPSIATKVLRSETRPGPGVGAWQEG